MLCTPLFFYLKLDTGTQYVTMQEVRCGAFATTKGGTVMRFVSEKLFASLERFQYRLMSPKRRAAWDAEKARIAAGGEPEHKGF